MSLINQIRSVFRKYLGLDVVRKKGKYLMLSGKRYQAMQTKFLGKTIYVHDNASFNLCLEELFDDEMYRFLSDKKNPFIVDCGANLGMSVLYFKHLYPEAQVLAYEADQHIFSFLKKNVDSFGYKDVQLCNQAVWYKEEVLEFLAEGGAGGRIEKSSEGHKFVQVQAIRLRDILEKNQVDFLKIDIEGAEYPVVKDCADLLSRIPFLFIEYHSMPDEPQRLHEILQMVADAGFRYQIKGAYAAKHPYVKQELNFGMDLQLNIFCYKEHSA
jgi:FkbM family methyltransferase